MASAMKYNYLVLGSGMQGTAAGYDLAKFGQASRVVMADFRSEVAEAAAKRINQLMKSTVAESLTVDAKNAASLRAALSGMHGLLSATSYELNEGITRAAIEAGVHMVDLGGNTDVVKAQLKMHEDAAARNISIIPDCGLAPGLGNTLAARGIEMLDKAEEIHVRCGGLPQTPRPPLGYKLVFSIKGLTNEYFGKAWIIRNSKVKEIDTFSELETLEFEKPVGSCEAFTTTGGISTCPWTFQDKVKEFTYKTVRYPGHFEKMKCMMDLGLLNTTPVKIGNMEVSPRDVFHAVVPEAIRFENDRDLVVLRATCHGMKNGKSKTIQFDLMDFHDEATGFTAMERCTAFPAALVLIHAVQGKTKKGAVPLEVALQNQEFLSDLNAHGLRIVTKET